MASRRFEDASPTLFVADVSKAIHYFEDALGFRRSYVNPGVLDGGVIYAIVDRDDISVHLARDSGRAGKSACCLFVAGVNEIYDEYRRNGVRILRKIEDSKDGKVDFVVSDYDGNEILIGESTRKE